MKKFIVSIIVIAVIAIIACCLGGVINKSNIAYVGDAMFAITALAACVFHNTQFKKL